MYAVSGTPGATRTLNRLLRRQLLYPLSYGGKHPYDYTVKCATPATCLRKKSAAAREQPPISPRFRLISGRQIRPAFALLLTDVLPPLGENLFYPIVGQRIEHHPPLLSVLDKVKIAEQS